jgi:hypothetical protein
VHQIRGGGTAMLFCVRINEYLKDWKWLWKIHKCFSILSSSTVSFGIIFEQILIKICCIAMVYYDIQFYESSTVHGHVWDKFLFVHSVFLRFRHATDVPPQFVNLLQEIYHRLNIISSKRKCL